MFEELHSPEDFENRIHNVPAALCYFSTPDCQVCKTLRPAVGEMAVTSFPSLKLFYVNLASAPELAARLRVFTVPSILVFFEGREYIRKSRHFGMEELRQEIARPYSLLEPD